MSVTNLFWLPLDADIKDVTDELLSPRQRLTNFSPRFVRQIYSHMNDVEINEEENRSRIAMDIRAKMISQGITKLEFPDLNGKLLLIEKGFNRRSNHQYS
jgi:hypothetical protein